MSFNAMVTTFAGAFIFPFLIRLIWGKFADAYGMIGGFLAAGFIVGTSWSLNHGVGMMFQTGAWIDQAYAAFVGLFVASALSGDKVSKGVVNAAFAIVGGVLGGFILSCLG